ncbi:MAG: hypothetical protein JXN62_12030, partial [Bacteroidales bacterium]|nr:hypothetical protein [Bacteroidales bacterium]
MKEIVYVIGAGASAEAKLPIGKDLKQIISEKLDINPIAEKFRGDPIIHDAIEYWTFSVDKNYPSNPIYFKKSSAISKALIFANSIDQYIENQKHDAFVSFCGKTAIIKSILEAEEKSILMNKTNGRFVSISPESLADTWYLPFFESITRGHVKDQLIERFKKISLIVFNYDRCIEHFLFHAIPMFFTDIKDIDELKEIMSSIEIIHVYGKVGDLEWQNDKIDVPFGYTLQNTDELVRFAENIRTFTEQMEPNNEDHLRIKELMKNTKKLVFLGFGFENQNMKILSPDVNKDSGIRRKCYGTIKGISLPDQKIIINDLKKA